MTVRLTSRLAAAFGALMLWMALGVTVAPPVSAGGSERPVSGVLAAASGTVMVRPMADPEARAVGLEVGQKVFFGDEIITDGGVRAQILLRDGTTFSIGEGANLVLDEFVYDPQSGDGGIGVVIRKGAFRFVSGKIAKKTPQNMKVLAGSTAIAVRGTEVIGTIGGGGHADRHGTRTQGHLDKANVVGIVLHKEDHGLVHGAFVDGHAARPSGSGAEGRLTFLGRKRPRLQHPREPASTGT